MFYRIRKSTIKRYSILRLGLVVLLTLALCGCNGLKISENSNDFIRKNCPIYYYNINNRYNVALYFRDGVEDLPYIGIEDAISLLSDFTKETYLYESDGLAMKVTRKDNEYYVTFDGNNQTIEFYDYNCFYATDDTLPILEINMNMLNNELFSCREDSVVNIYGDIVTIDLKKYGISYYVRNDKLYLPLQTFVDLFLSPLNIIVNYANGEVYALRNVDYISAEGGLSELAKRYYSNRGIDRSSELIEYNYNELCLCLDVNYGLKTEHNIADFDNLFMNAGYDIEIKDENAENEAKALESLTRGVFGDSHSRYVYPSCCIKEGYVMNEGTSVSKSITDYSSNERIYESARHQVYREGCPCYEEVGNTAYITLDDFKIDLKKNYYEEKITKDATDTIEAVNYANSRINRSNSPIENVVIDLSNNTGGDIEAAIYLLAWCMGDAPFYLTDAFTGAATTASYRADINLDHRFDDKDQLINKNIYCLISPVSFSCANMVPAVLKSTGMVSIIGARSGGGTSIVSVVSTADGNVLEISSTKIISTLKNGSYYSVDEGVEPDYRIDKISNFYNRNSLTDYINSLY